MHSRDCRPLSATTGYVKTINKEFETGVLNNRPIRQHFLTNYKRYFLIYTIVICSLAVIKFKRKC